MLNKIFKTRKQRERESKITKQKQLIKLAEENGINIPPTFERSEYCRKRSYIGMPCGWYRSLETRARIAERELKKKGLI